MAARRGQRGRRAVAVVAARERERASGEALQGALRAAQAGRTWKDAAEFKKPVTQNFLALVFDMDPATVKKRLLRCPTLGNEGGGRPIYEFKVAVGYLIKPTMNMAEYIKTLNPADMPNVIKVQSGYKVRPLSQYLNQPAPPASRWASATVRLAPFWISISCIGKRQASVPSPDSVHCRMSMNCFLMKSISAMAASIQIGRAHV